MADDRIWTAAELEQLSPDERDRVVKDGIVTDLTSLPPDFLARARAKGRALLAEREAITPAGEGSTTESWAPPSSSVIADKFTPC